MVSLKNNVIFIAFVIIVIALLFSVSGHRAPRIPEDVAHNVAKDKTYCLNCHGPDGEARLSKDHPPKDQCFICHKFKDRKKNI